ncbi:MAG: hypothetical protein NTY19_44910 [Planctomycetota bacterium]|nr:hypothetical protein [Planctomycetota bacterium]
MPTRRGAKAAIVDTNVLLVADGKQVDISREGCSCCILALQLLMKQGRIAVDEAGAILREYLKKTKPWNPQKVGELFLKWVLDNHYNEARCDRIPITPRVDDSEDYEEFPRDERLQRFERADRKFVAVALAHPQRPAIQEASDTDFYEFREVLAEHGVRVDFLCESDLRRLYHRKHAEQARDTHD